MAGGSPAGPAGSWVGSAGCGARAGAGCAERAGSTGKLARAIVSGASDCSTWRAGRATSRLPPAVGGCVTSPPRRPSAAGTDAPSGRDRSPTGAWSPGGAAARVCVATGSALRDGAGRSLISAPRGVGSGGAGGRAAIPDPPLSVARWCRTGSSPAGLRSTVRRDGLWEAASVARPEDGSLVAAASAPRRPPSGRCSCGRVDRDTAAPEVSGTAVEGSVVARASACGRRSLAAARGGGDGSGSRCGPGAGASEGVPPVVGVRATARSAGVRVGARLSPVAVRSAAARGRWPVAARSASGRASSAPGRGWLVVSTREDSLANT